ncbi:hypothetical protein AAC387_Pa02g0516 [Persea americana]
MVASASRRSAVRSSSKKSCQARLDSKSDVEDSSCDPCQNHPFESFIIPKEKKMRPEDKRNIELQGAEFLESQHVQVESQGSPFNEKEEEGRKTI